MSDKLVSVDEFIATQKGAVKSGDIVVKGFKAPSSWDQEKRSARFTISAQAEDRDRDVIHQAGLDTSHFERNPVALMFHNSRSWPIGLWSDIAKNLTGRPKRTEATLNLLEEGVEPDADRAARHIAAGTLTTCSIGFIPKAVRRREVPDDKKDEPYYWPGYEIMEAELVEVSVVPVPSLREAAVKAAGGSDGFVMPREVIEEILDNWAKHPETGLIVPRSELERLHARASGEPTTITITNTGAPIDPASIRVIPGKEASGERTSVVLPPGSPETDVSGKERPSPSEPTLETGPREHSLLRRAIKRLTDAVFGEEGEALITNALQAELAAEEDEAKRKAVAAERLKQINEKTAAMDERLRSKGLLTESA